jgi:hypothetical protein
MKCLNHSTIYAQDDSTFSSLTNPVAKKLPLGLLNPYHAVYGAFQH